MHLCSVNKYLSNLSLDMTRDNCKVVIIIYKRCICLHKCVMKNMCFDNCSFLIHWIYPLRQFYVDPFCFCKQKVIKIICKFVSDGHKKKHLVNSRSNYHHERICKTFL